MLVICIGGGIPVAVDSLGGPRGVEAVIDKDLSAALPAQFMVAEQQETRYERTHL